MRSALDRLVSWTGLVMALTLLVAGGLLSYASSYVDGEVADQLSMQGITMPTEDALETDAQHAALDRFAGQQMTDGDQAKAFADHYILDHMDAASGGRTYEEVSSEFMALVNDPAADQAEVAELGQLRQTLFMGNTLRGLLLNAYAFDTMGEIAAVASYAAFAGAALLLLLALLGLRHAKHVARRFGVPAVATAA